MSRQRRSALALALVCGWWFFALGACTHTIHVAPVPPSASKARIDQTLRVLVPLLALEGSDHMPGIPLLEWQAADLRQSIIEYVRQRGTFALVDDDEGMLTLEVKGWLFLRSRETYRYVVHLESDLGPTGKPPLKSYVVKKEAVGSRIRWLTADDQRPIAEAVQAALDDLLTQIEEDAALFGKS